MPENISCDIGIIVHNEAANIGKLLKAFLAQETRTAVIRNIIVVSSASTDQTDEIVESFARNNPSVRLITEPTRGGKSSAINKFLAVATAEVRIVSSGDVLPERDVVEKLVSLFADSTIGMAGGRPIPENSPGTFIGYAVNLLWRLHHRMATISPKLGEMIAFRDIVVEIPPKSAVDEASIEGIIRKAGLRLVYCGDAIIHNKGPETLRDFIRQRRRIAAGHYWLLENQHYMVVSLRKRILLRITLQELLAEPRQGLRLLLTMGLEIWCRFLGWWDYNVRHKNPFTWEIAKTTKNLKTDL